VSAAGDGDVGVGADGPRLRDIHAVNSTEIRATGSIIPKRPEPGGTARTSTCAVLPGPKRARPVTRPENEYAGGTSGGGQAHAVPASATPPSPPTDGRADQK
jgi:hypothetical protein